MSDEQRPEPDARRSGEGASHDARDLRRGVAVNMVGYAIKLAHPIMLAIATRLYGAERWGVFVVAQAAVMLLARLCLFGLDKGILWWVPRQEEAGERSGIAGALLISGATASALATGVALVPAEWLAIWGETGEVTGSIRIMAAGVVPMVAMEILLHATMAKRRMEPQVLVRETLVPLVLLGAATAFWWVGLEGNGLALAFLLSNVVGLAGAAIAFRRLFRGSQWPREHSTRVPPALARYSAPLWISEMTNTALLRMDVVILAAVTDPLTVGVYGIVVQFANAVRSIRRSFDPIVTAIVSRISARPDPARLSAGYSYATVLVTVTQIPVLVFLATFGAWLLPLYGEGFEVGAIALVVFCAFWGVLGAAGLAGIVVSGYGYSKLTLLNVIVALLVQAPLVWFLAPRWGLEGAAAAVGIAYAVQHTMQLVEMRLITGQWGYTRAVLPGFGSAALAVGLLVAARVLLLPAGESAARIGSFALFLSVYGGAMLFLHRTGRLAAPAEHASAPAAVDASGGSQTAPEL